MCVCVLKSKPKKWVCDSNFFVLDKEKTRMCMCVCACVCALKNNPKNLNFLYVYVCIDHEPSHADAVFHSYHHSILFDSILFVKVFILRRVHFFCKIATTNMNHSKIGENASSSYDGFNMRERERVTKWKMDNIVFLCYIYAKN